MAGESPPRIESPPRKRPCTHCGGLSGSQVPDWDLLLGRRELPDSSVLLLPDAPPGASEGVSLSVQALHKCAPRILQILEESEAKSPLSISVPLSLDELRCLVLMSNGGDLSDQDAVSVAAQQQGASFWTWTHEHAAGLCEHAAGGNVHGCRPV